MVKTVHVVPHTHWDREWFFTTSRAQVYLLKDLKDVIDNLENNVGFSHFILDGQASLIADYLKWRPQDLEKVQKLVKSKKLIIGPWYTQTDQYVPSGENIIRNLLYGMKTCSKLGGYMNIGYVPDSFGQESSMPQIYKGLGIDNAVLWRGFPDYEAKHSEFVWQGEDGSQINVYRMACGYFIGGLIDENNLDKIMTSEPFASVVKQATTDQILFPQGSDMAPARNNLPEVIKKFNAENKDFKFKISSLEDYINSVNQEHPQLDLLKGEFNIGKNMRVHKTNYSSRSDLKKMNTLIQDYLTNVLEPVLTLGEQFGISYPKETVDDIWEKLFENSAHDSMANSVSDNVNEDIYLRYKQARDIATSLVELTLRQIAVQVEKPDDKVITLTVFNTELTSKNGLVTKNIYTPSKNFEIQDKDGNPVLFVVDGFEDETDEVNGATIQLNPGEKIYKPEKVYRTTVTFEVKDIPAMGYQQYYLVPNSGKTVQLTSSDKNVIENDYYKIEINPNGSLKITRESDGAVFDQQAILEDNGDEGDSYNYSPAKKDWIIYSTDQAFKFDTKVSPLVNKFKIDYDFKVPADLEERAQKKASALMPVSLVVELEQGSPVIRFKVTTDNRQPLDHRLCIDFDTQIIADGSIDDIQFGSIKRPFELKKALEDWKKNPDDWQEKPISINTMQTFTSLSDKKNTFAIFPNGVREYEDINENHSTIRLTLFRTYGRLGKSDLLYRPGRASGDATVATPNAELRENLSFDFGVYITDQNFEESDVANTAKDFKTGLQVFEYAKFLNGRLIFPLNEVKRKLPKQYSSFETKDKLTLSTVKKAENRNGYVIRLYNGLFNDIEDEIKFIKVPKTVELVDLKEDTIETLKVQNGVVKLPKLAHAKVMSIYYEF